MPDRWEAIRRLRRRRPRSLLLRASLALFIVLVAAAWLSGELRAGDLFTARRAANLERFLARLAPESVGDLPWSTGAEAAAITLAISVLAIVLAGFAGALLSLPAARNFVRPDPFAAGATGAGILRRAVGALVLWTTRIFLLFLRSIPEYIWAYLFLALLGPTAWPAVLALALHNTGTLGKLDAEVVENLSPGPLTALRSVGAGRYALAAFGIFPLALGRFLLYFFYRFETCVRESTILGMLGIVSLGYFISEARALRAYEEMLFFILLGAGLVLIADLLSALTRRLVRRA